MSHEKNLKERIKELTCLYEVSSIIVNSNHDDLPKTLSLIAMSVRKAVQFPKAAVVELKTDDQDIVTAYIPEKSVSIESPVPVFNEKHGYIRIHYPADKHTKNDFLVEEKKLLKNVAISVGDLLERIIIRQNERLLKRKMEHADRLAIVGEMTAGIAHELNTPLTNILGFAELLKSKDSIDNQGRKDIDKIIKSALFSREVVKKLMFFACEMPQTLTELNIVPLVEDAVKMLDATFRQKEVRYELNLPSSAVMLKADAVQLTQVVFNLLLNAIYFSPAKGSVSIDVERDSKKLSIRIADQGPGIPPENKSKIFQPFFTTKAVGDGSGLGLSVVHGIVRAHGGTIEIESNEPGAVFIVSFPNSK